MKRKLLMVLIPMASLMYAQENASGQKSFFGVQAGLFGVNVYNEYSIKENFILRTDIDFSPSIWGGDLYTKTGFAVAPELRVSPKWYYNLEKRKADSKNTAYNAANYLAAKIGFVPDFLVISNVDGIKVNPMISFVPTWGLRRNFAEHFNYELQLGLGVGKILKSGYDIQAVPNLSFKIGYDF